MSASIVEILLSGLTDSNGNPLNGGKVYTQVAGGSSQKTCWTDKDETSPAAYPVILDTYGRAQIYCDGWYKFVVTDSNDAPVATWDNLFFPAVVTSLGTPGLDTNISSEKAVRTTLTALAATILTAPVVSTKTSDYVMISGDKGSFLLFNKATAISYTILSAGSAGSGFWVYIENIGVGVLTVTGATIDGQNNPLLAQYDGRILFSDGTNWHSFIMSRRVVLFEVLQSGSPIFAIDSGSADVYVATFSPAIIALTDGMVLWVKITHANATQTPTLNVNSLGAKVILRNDNGGVLNVGDLLTNNFYCFQYSGTNFRLMNPYFTIHPKVRNDVTSSRAIGSTYQNLTGRVLFVNVMLTSAGGAGNILAYSDASTPPTFLVAAMSASAIALYVMLSFIVLPGDYYLVSQAPAVFTPQKWIEWS